MLEIDGLKKVIAKNETTINQTQKMISVRNSVIISSEVELINTTESKRYD